MNNKFKEQFTPKEWQRLVEIARYFGIGESSGSAGHPNHVNFTNMLKEISGDENIGCNPVLGNSGIEKIGGSILRYLLETVAVLANLLQEKNKQIEDMKLQYHFAKEETKDIAVDITKACESATKKKDYRECVNILGNLLTQPEDELYI